MDSSLVKKYRIRQPILAGNELQRCPNDGSSTLEYIHLKNWMKQTYGTDSTKACVAISRVEMWNVNSPTGTVCMLGVGDQTIKAPEYFKIAPP